jgi:hypothetical protein
MAIQFSPLPLNLFEPKLRHHIELLNLTLRDLAGLEGVLTTPIEDTGRSDRTVVRKSSPSVSVTRLVPSITNIINGSSSAIGAPDLTFSTTNAVGTTNTVVAINSTVKFPQAVMALGTTATVTLTNDVNFGALLTANSAFGVSRASLLPPNSNTPLTVYPATVARDGSDFAAVAFGYGFVMRDNAPNFWRLLMSSDGIPYITNVGSAVPGT